MFSLLKKESLFASGSRESETDLYKNASLEFRVAKKSVLGKAFFRCFKIKFAASISCPLGFCGKAIATFLYSQSLNEKSFWRGNACKCNARSGTVKAAAKSFFALFAKKSFNAFYVL